MQARGAAIDGIKAHLKSEIDKERPADMPSRILLNTVVKSKDLVLLPYQRYGYMATSRQRSRISAPLLNHRSGWNSFELGRTFKYDKYAQQDYVQFHAAQPPVYLSFLSLLDKPLSQTVKVSRETVGLEG